MTVIQYWIINPQGRRIEGPFNEHEYDIAKGRANVLNFRDNIAYCIEMDNVKIKIEDWVSKNNDKENV